MAYSQYWPKDLWPNLLEDIASNKAAVNFSGDSSPQFGRDWFLMVMHIIKDLALLDDILADLVAKLPTDIVTVDEWDQWLEAQTQGQIAELAALSSKINAIVLRNVLIPTGLAARQT